MIRDPKTGKRVPRVNPESERVIQEVPHLRIIEEQLWNRVQARLEAIRAAPATQKIRASGFWLCRRPKHLLTGLVNCGSCGGSFAAVGSDYLACAAARKKGTCQNRQGIRRGELEELILNGLKDSLMQPELVKEFIGEFSREINRQRHARELHQDARRKELAQVTRKLDGLIDAIADGLRTAGLKSKLDELERRKADLEAELTEVRPPAPRLHPNLAELYRRQG